MNGQEDGEWLESEGAKSVADAKQLTEVRNHLNLLLKLNELHIVIAWFTCFCFRSFVRSGDLCDRVARSKDLTFNLQLVVGGGNHWSGEFSKRGY